MVSPKWAFLSPLVFLFGIAALLTGWTRGRRLTALLIVSPFALGFATAVFHVLPFVGSRHQAYLLPFLAAGLSAGLTWLPRNLATPLLILSVLMVPRWLAHNAPDNNPRILPIGDMRAAINYIQTNIPLSTPLFVDEESRYELGYYLGREDSSLDLLRPLQSNERIGGRRIIAPMGYVWSFTPNEVLPQLNQSARAIGLPRGADLWIVSVAWSSTSLASHLLPKSRIDAEESGLISVIESSRN